MPCTVLILGDELRYANYKRAVEAAGGRARHASAPGFEAECDALLLPGGGDLEPWRYGQRNTASRGLEPWRDAAEFALLDHFVAARKPVLGICRGMQSINVYFGGTLIQDLPGHGAIDGADRTHAVFAVSSCLVGVCGQRCTVNSAHHQAVETLGVGLQAVQWADDGVVEAICHRTLPVWGVQWHPERLPPGSCGQRLFAAFLALCRREEAAPPG